MLPSHKFPHRGAAPAPASQHDDGSGWEHELDEGTLEVLKEMELTRLHQAMEEQALAAKLGRDRRTLPNGEVQMMVHPAFFHHWGQRLGYDCWKDEQFQREFLRDNDACRVVSRSERPMVPGWRAAMNYGNRRKPAQAAPVAPPKNPKRFSKRYSF